jgi:hypothetical protein
MIAMAASGRTERAYKRGSCTEIPIIAVLSDRPALEGSALLDWWVAFETVHLMHARVTI